MNEDGNGIGNWKWIEIGLRQYEKAEKAKNKVESDEKMEMAYENVNDGKMWRRNGKENIVWNGVKQKWGKYVNEMRDLQWGRIMYGNEEGKCDGNLGQ
jgi:hypothetical protein